MHRVLGNISEFFQCCTQCVVGVCVMFECVVLNTTYEQRRYRDKHELCCVTPCLLLKSQLFVRCDCL